jgi:DNA-binding NtrC family response regulator
MREQRITAPTVDGLRNIRAILTTELERGDYDASCVSSITDALEAVNAEIDALKAGE